MSRSEPNVRYLTAIKVDVREAAATETGVPSFNALHTIPVITEAYDRSLDLAV